MSEYVQSKSVKTTPLMRRVIIYAALLLVVFLLGFGPMWLKSRECSRNLSEAERQAASSFFTSLQAETNKGDDSALSQAQREEYSRCLPDVMSLSLCLLAVILVPQIGYLICMCHIVRLWAGEVALVVCGIMNRPPHTRR
jgi:hypothetical protein